MKNRSQDKRCLGRDSNRRTPEHKCRSLTVGQLVPSDVFKLCCRLEVVNLNKVTILGNWWVVFLEGGVLGLTLTVHSKPFSESYVSLRTPL
jgi:hypothetical protein